MSDPIVQAELQRMLEETKKFVAEHDKLIAESNKLVAEGDKLKAEARKLNIDRWVAPVIVVFGGIGSLIAGFAAVWRLLQ